MFRPSLTGRGLRNRRRSRATRTPLWLGAVRDPADPFERLRAILQRALFGIGGLDERDDLVEPGVDPRQPANADRAGSVGVVEMPVRRELMQVAGAVGSDDLVEGFGVKVGAALKRVARHLLVNSKLEGVDARTACQREQSEEKRKRWLHRGISSQSISRRLNGCAFSMESDGSRLRETL